MKACATTAQLLSLLWMIGKALLSLLSHLAGPTKFLTKVRNHIFLLIDVKNMVLMKKCGSHVFVRNSQSVLLDTLFLLRGSPSSGEMGQETRITAGY